MAAHHLVESSPAKHTEPVSRRVETPWRMFEQLSPMSRALRTTLSAFRVCMLCAD